MSKKGSLLEWMMLDKEKLELQLAEKQEKERRLRESKEEELHRKELEKRILAVSIHRQQYQADLEERLKYTMQRLTDMKDIIGR